MSCRISAPWSFNESTRSLSQDLLSKPLCLVYSTCWFMLHATFLATKRFGFLPSISFFLRSMAMASSSIFYDDEYSHGRLSICKYTKFCLKTSKPAPAFRRRAVWRRETACSALQNGPFREAERPVLPSRCAPGSYGGGRRPASGCRRRVAESKRSCPQPLRGCPAATGLRSPTMRRSAGRLRAPRRPGQAAKTRRHAHFSSKRWAFRL